MKPSSDIVLSTGLYCAVSVPLGTNSIRIGVTIRDTGQAQRTIYPLTGPDPSTFGVNALVWSGLYKRFAGRGG